MSSRRGTDWWDDYATEEEGSGDVTLNDLPEFVIPSDMYSCWHDEYTKERGGYITDNYDQFYDFLALKVIAGDEPENPFTEGWVDEL